MPTLVTYKIVSDDAGKLKAAARVACNFWNRFVAPSRSIIIRLGLFTSFGNVIARAYKPYDHDGSTYGNIEFNSVYLSKFQPNEIASTIAHEIGHSLGFGWDDWMLLFDPTTGAFNAAAVGRLPTLADMQVETDFGPGTTLVHWDEEHFIGELMTGLKDDSEEYVLPVTIDVMALLGHHVIERLGARTALFPLLDQLTNIQFLMIDAAEALDRDHYVPTEIREEIYSSRRTPIAPK
jgi:hypothetical protein